MQLPTTTTLTGKNAVHVMFYGKGAVDHGRDKYLPAAMELGNIFGLVTSGTACLCLYRQRIDPWGRVDAAYLASDMDSLGNVLGAVWWWK